MYILERKGHSMGALTEGCITECMHADGLRVEGFEEWTDVWLNELLGRMCEQIGD